MFGNKKFSRRLFTLLSHFLIAHNLPHQTTIPLGTFLKQRKRSGLHILKRATLTIVLTMSATWGHGQAPGAGPMSHEETVVRTTYARLAYAAQVKEVHNAISD